MRVAELGGQAGRGAPGEIGQVGVGGLQVQPLLLGPGQRRQVIGQPAQAVQFLADRREDFRFGGRIRRR